MKEGTPAVLLQSGLGERWWAESIECYCYLRDVGHQLSDGNTPYKRRFGVPFKEANNSFLVQWLNIIRFQREITQDFINLAPGIFLGYELITVGFWRKMF